MIAIPMHKTPEPKTVICIDNVIEDFALYGTGHSILKLIKNGVRVEEAQGEALQKAMEESCVGVLFWEDDMVVPVRAAAPGVQGFNPLLRLLSHDKDIIGAPYITRTKPPRPVMAMADKNGLPTNLQDESLYGLDSSEPFQCPFIGTGFTWISRRAILRMMQAYGDDCSKFFEPESVCYYEPEFLRGLEEQLEIGATAAELLGFIKHEQRLGRWMKQDYAFCARAREAGIEIWIDPIFDAQHLGTYGYDRRDWIATKREAADRAAEG